MTPFPNPPAAPCCSFPAPATECMCSPNEQVVRAYMDGDVTVPMSAEQRAWCVAEVRRASDATDQPETFDQHSDKELASATYWSWVDYCRDKGLA